MDQVMDFFSMGNYGAYIWTAYSLTAIVMLSLLVTTLQRLRKNQAELEELQNLRESALPDSALSDSAGQGNNKEETANP